VTPNGPKFSRWISLSCGVVAALREDRSGATTNVDMRCATGHMTRPARHVSMLPLTYNPANVAAALSIGAVWHITPDAYSSEPKGAILTSLEDITVEEKTGQVSGTAVFTRPASANTPPVRVDLDVLTAAAQERRGFHTGRDAFATNNGFRLIHAGNLLPDHLQEYLAHGVLPQRTTSKYNINVTRGPVINVVEDPLDVSTLDPQELTVADIKALDLADREAFTDFDYYIRLLQGCEDLSMNTAIDAADVLRAAIAWLQFTENFDQALKLPTSINSRYINDGWDIRVLANDRNRPLLPHIDPEQPGLLRYFENTKALTRNRTMSTRPGKYVARFTNDQAAVKAATNLINMSLFPAEFSLLTEPEEVVAAFMSGPSSCASHPIARYVQTAPRTSSLEYHPSAVYGGDSDTALAVMRRGDSIIARAVVNTHNKRFPEVYGLEGTQARGELEEWLTQNGYTRDNAALVGARLRRLELPRLPEDRFPWIVKPYLDKSSLCVLDCGSHLVVTGQNLAQNPSAVASPGTLALLEERLTLPIYTYNNSYDQGAFNCSGDISPHLQGTATYRYCDSCGALSGASFAVVGPLGTLEHACKNCQVEVNERVLVHINPNGEIELSYRLIRSTTPTVMCSGALIGRLFPEVVPMMTDAYGVVIAELPEGLYEQRLSECPEVTPVTAGDGLRIAEDEACTPADSTTTLWKQAAYRVELNSGETLYLRHRPYMRDNNDYNIDMRAIAQETLHTQTLAAALADAIDVMAEHEDELQAEMVAALEQESHLATHYADALQYALPGTITGRNATFVVFDETSTHATTTHGTGTAA
jgi:hypothetical protein